MKDNNETQEKLAMFQRIQDELRDINLTEADFYKSIGTDSQNWNNWKNRGLPHSQATKIINRLNWTYSYLFSGQLPKYKKDIAEHEGIYMAQKSKQHYPKVVGTARCGNNGFYMELENGDGFIEMNAKAGSIAIRIKGHSMHPAIKEDWFVIIQPEKEPMPGEYVLIKFLDGRKMVKELLQKKSDGYLLLSVNSNERITALHTDIEGIEAITAIVPPSMHKEWS